MGITNLGVIPKLRLPFATGQIAGPPIPNLTDYYWLVMYTSAALTSTLDLVLLNLTTDIASVITGPMGNPINSGFQFHPTSGLMYYATYMNASTPSPLVSFDFLNGVSDVFAHMPQYPNNDYAQPGFAMCSDESPSRVFYASGDGGQGLLCAWTPGSPGSLQNYGVIDDPSPPHVRYISSMHIGATYAYCAMHESSGSYLCIVRLSDGAVTAKWKGTSGLNLVEVYRGTTGTPPAIYIHTTPGLLASDWWSVSGTSDPTGISAPSVMNLHTYNPQPTFTGYSRGVSKFATGLPPYDSVGDKHVVLQYTSPGHPAEWAEIPVELSRLDDYAIQRIGIQADSTALISQAVPGGQSGRFFNYDPITGGSKNLGGAGAMSGYSFCVDRFRNKMFLGGYPDGSFFIYDPASPWSASNPLQRAFTNESHVGSGKYIGAIERMADKSIWVGGEYVRQAYNAELMSYDPDTDVDSLIEFDRISDYSFINMAANQARSYMVMSGSLSTDNSINKLFVFQVFRSGTDRLTKTITPPAGGPWHICSIEDGTLANTNLFIGIQVSNSPYKAFCINIAAEEIIWHQDSLNGQSYILDYATPAFAYGYVWFFANTNLVKMDPATGTVTNATISSTPVTIADGYKGMAWDTVKKILYLFNDGPTGVSFDLLRVEGIDGI